MPHAIRPFTLTGKGTTHKNSKTMCNASSWLPQCWKTCANGSKIVALRFDDHETKEMLGVVQKFDRFQTLRTRNNMRQSVQTDATCIIQQFVVSQESCDRLHGALLGKREGKHGITGLTRQKDSVKCSTCKRRFWPSFGSL